MPFPHTVIVLTGLCEIAGAVCLLTGRLHRTAGVAFALYAICVYPANLKHAFEAPVGAAHLGDGITARGWPFQPVLVWWVSFAGNVLTWPFKASEGRPKVP